jgi:transcription antitermination protein NusB
VDAITYKDVYIDKINERLNEEWTFARLGFVEQAILLMACCELDLETAPKPIVIDEAITLAKKYCDDEAYKLINGVLDRL